MSRTPRPSPPRLASPIARSACDSFRKRAEPVGMAGAGSRADGVKASVNVHDLAGDGTRVV